VTDRSQISLFVDQARERRITQWTQAALSLPGGRRALLVPPRLRSEEIELAAERLDRFLSSEEGKAALHLMAAAGIRQTLASYTWVTERTSFGYPIAHRTIEFGITGSGIYKFDSDSWDKVLLSGKDLKELFEIWDGRKIKPSKFVPALRRSLNQFVQLLPERRKLLRA